MRMQGVRGATTVDVNDKTEIMTAVEELLRRLAEANGIAAADIGAAIFSATPDLTAAFPAAAARRIGWEQVPLFGAQEIDVAQGVAKCIRVLLLWHTDRAQADIRHVYLRRAARLRPDLTARSSREDEVGEDQAATRTAGE